MSISTSNTLVYTLNDTDLYGLRSRIMVYQEPRATTISKWDAWLQAQKERHSHGAISLHKRLLGKRLKVIATL